MTKDKQLILLLLVVGVSACSKKPPLPAFIYASPSYEHSDTFFSGYSEPSESEKIAFLNAKNILKDTFYQERLFEKLLLENPEKYGTVIYTNIVSGSYDESVSLRAVSAFFQPTPFCRDILLSLTKSGNEDIEKKSAGGLKWQIQEGFELSDSLISSIKDKDYKYRYDLTEELIQSDRIDFDLLVYFLQTELSTFVDWIHFIISQSYMVEGEALILKEGSTTNLIFRENLKYLSLTIYEEKKRKKRGGSR